MRISRWSVRILSLLQLALVLPPLMSGFVCIPASGSAGSELGFCACAASLPDAAVPTIDTPGTPGCGSCRDEALSAVRVARPAATQAPVDLPCASPYVIVLAAPIAEPRFLHLGVSPGSRQPILRC